MERWAQTQRSYLKIYTVLKSNLWARCFSWYDRRTKRFHSIIWFVPEPVSGTPKVPEWPGILPSSYRPGLYDPSTGPLKLILSPACGNMQVSYHSTAQKHCKTPGACQILPFRQWPQGCRCHTLQRPSSFWLPLSCNG
jgi:hypothetical protein